MYDRLTHHSECEADPHYIRIIKSKINFDEYHYCELCFEHFVKRGDACCNKQQLAFVQYPNAGGRVQLRKQCMNCFTLQGNNYKFSEVPDIKKLPLVIEKDYQQRNNIWNEYTKFREWLNDKRKKAFFKQHDNYLHSQEWRCIRAAVLKRDNYICQGCLITKASEVHHLTYERWKNEMAYDLISLCTQCHKKVHNK